MISVSKLEAQCRCEWNSAACGIQKIRLDDLMAPFGLKTSSADLCIPSLSFSGCEHKQREIPARAANGTSVCPAAPTPLPASLAPTSRAAIDSVGSAHSPLSLHRALLWGQPPGAGRARSYPETRRPSPRATESKAVTHQHRNPPR